jgi:hypothetical protein
MGHNKFAAQFTESQKNVANYLQHLLVAEGYLVTETVQIGQKQVIKLSAPVDANVPDRENFNLIRSSQWQRDARS